jgi:hypothetical protein
MTQVSSFWDGSSGSGDVGPYNSAEYSQVYWQSLGFGASNFPDFGVIRGAFNDLAVSANSPAAANVVVATGSALIQGRWYYSDASETLTITSNGSGNPRIDLIVLRASYTGASTKTIRLAVKTGTPGVSPAIPGLTQNLTTEWEIPLARVAVANGFSTIVAADITDMRSFVNVPDTLAVNITNQSAAVLEKGALLVRTTSPTGYPIAATTTVTANDNNALGILESRLAIGATGRAYIRGVVPVTIQGSVSVGDQLTTSTTAGRVQTRVAGQRSLGVALQAGASGAVILAHINMQGYADIDVYPRMALGSYTGNGAATQAITGVGFQPTVLMIFPRNAVQSPTWKTSGDGLNAATFSPGAYQADIIISLDANGFTVGDATALPALYNMNTNAVVFNYVVWRVN